MKTSQLIRLGHKSIIAHKKRSFLTIAAVGLLFGVLVAMNFVAQGIENNVLHAGLDVTDGKVITAVNICDGNYKANQPIDFEHNEPVYSGEKMCAEPATYDKIATEKSKKYNGNFLGAKITYINDEGEMIYAIPENAAKSISSKHLYEVADEKIPIVVSSEIDDTVQNEIDKNTFEVIGKYASSQVKISAATNPNENESLIDKIIMSGSAKDLFYIVYDNLKMPNFLASHNYQVYYYEPLIEFNNFDDAYHYYKTESCLTSDCHYDISEIFAGNIDTRLSYNSFYKDNKNIMIFFLVVAAIIMMFSSIRIIKGEAKNIALYRSLGATKKDVFLIHLFQLLEITFFAVAFAFLAGLLLALVINSMYAEKIGASISANFGYSFTISLLVGFNIYHLIIALIMVLLAPICALLSFNKKSPIARRLY